MRRATKWLGAVLVLGVAACAQIAGLGDEPMIVTSDAGVDGHTEAPPDAGGGRLDGGPVACGLSTGSSGCQACVAANCCTQASACAGNIACSEYEDCVIPCGGDDACRARCLIAHPATLPGVAAMDQCVASSCGGACGIQCGITSTFAEPDAADGCQQCIVANACDAATACGTDVACTRISQCAAACVTIDCMWACGEEDDAGGALFASYLLAGSACLAPCDIGSYWECLPNVMPPFATTAQIEPTFSFGTSGAGATVVACDFLDEDCAAPRATGTCDAQGNVTLTLPTEGPGGFAGFFEVSSPTLTTELIFLEFGLTVPHVTISLPVSIPSFVQGLYDTAHASQLDGHGTIWAQATDCHGSPAPNVTIDAVKTDADTVRIYDGNGAATNGTGWAFFVDAPSQSITLSVTSPDRGLVTSGVNVFVKTGAVSAIVLHPN